MVKSQAGTDQSGNRSGQFAGELDRDQFWIDLFAFATSPRGLGLDVDTFQWLSWREVAAHKHLWAEERAMFFNANFSTDGIAFIAEDFLGTGNREERKALQKLSDREAQMANMSLEMLKPGDTDGVPLWAVPLKNRKPSA